MIPTRERPDLLAAAVRSILDGTKLPAEIIVVDQSANADAHIVGLSQSAGNRLRYLHRPDIRGVSRARNEGVRTAERDLLVLIDDDVVVAPDWWECLLLACEQVGPRAAISGRVLPGAGSADGGKVPSTILDIAPAVHTDSGDRDVLFTNNCAIPRCAFEELGLFDEHLDAGAHWPAAGDNDFAARLLRSGYAIHYRPEVVVTHVAWRSPGQLRLLRWKYGRGQGGFLAKHASIRNGHATGRFMRGLAREARCALGMALRGDKAAIDHALFGAGLLAGFLEWIIRRPSRPPGLAERPPDNGVRNPLLSAADDPR